VSHSRYALYLTPPLDSDLWTFGCDVIGRDASTGRAVEGFAPEGYSPESWRRITEEPRRYGFHATLVAPFQLRGDLDGPDLIDAVTAFARSAHPFDAGALQVGRIGAGSGHAFVALKPIGPARELHAFAEKAVRRLDALRAPLTNAERLKRASGRLTPLQRYYLDVWGYPYVLNEFRPHFTLTSPVAEAKAIEKALRWDFQMRVASPLLRVETLTLFGERERDGAFEILRAFPLGHGHSARRGASRMAAVA